VLQGSSTNPHGPFLSNPHPIPASVPPWVHLPSVAPVAAADPRGRPPGFRCIGVALIVPSEAPIPPPPSQRSGQSPTHPRGGGTLGGDSGARSRAPPFGTGQDREGSGPPPACFQHLFLPALPARAYPLCPCAPDRARGPPPPRPPFPFSPPSHRPVSVVPRMWVGVLRCLACAPTPTGVRGGGGAPKGPLLLSGDRSPPLDPPHKPSNPEWDPHQRTEQERFPENGLSALRRCLGFEVGSVTEGPEAGIGFLL